MSNTSTPRSAAKIGIIWHGVLFVSVLVVLNLAMNSLLADPFREVLRRLTGRMAASLLLPFGQTTFDGLQLISNGFVMKIAVECTAMPFLTIFVAGVIAYPQQGATYKIIGIAMGTSALLFLNAIRIAVLGLAGTYAPEAFDFLHLYLWQSLYALLVVAAWVLWAQKMVIDRPLVMKIGIALIVSVSGFTVLSAFMPEYLKALAAAVGPIARLLFDHAPRAMIVSGEVVALNFEAVSASTRTIAVNAYNQVIFVSLMATTFVQGSGLEVVRRTFYGLGIFFLLLLGHVMLLILGVLYNVPAARMDVLDVSVRTFSISLCIGLYLIFARKLRASRKNTSDREGGKINEKMVIAY